MAKPPQEPAPPRTSAAPAKPIATVSGAAPRKPAAQTLVGYDAPNPDTLVGYDLKDEAPATHAAPAAAHVRSAGAPPKPVARPSAAPPKPVARPSAAPPKPAARPSAAPTPRGSAPPPAPSAPLQSTEVAELDAVLGTTRTLDSASIEMLTSQELVLEPERPQRTDITEELTNLDVERLSVGTPPPVPGTSLPPSLDDLPKAKRGWAFIAAPIVLLMIAGVAYTVWSSNEAEESAQVTPTTTTDAPTMAAAAPDTSMAEAPSMTVAAAPSMTAAPSTTMDAPAAPSMTATTPPAATASSASTAMAADSAPSMTATPATTMTAESATAMTAAAVPAPAPAAAVAPFPERRLRELAPMPDVTPRIARMRDSARASRAERELRAASRDLRSDDYEDAIENYNNALQYVPDSIEAMIGLATVAIEQEKWDVALAWTQRAMVVDARNVSVLLLRGDALAGAGNRDAAREVWRSVLEIDPRNRDARSRMRRRGSRRR